MGVFDDKKFENLDWISQATGPIDSRLNEVLSLVPDEIIIDFDMFKRMTNDGYSLDLSVDRAIGFAIQEYASNIYLSWQEKNTLQECFEFVMEEGINLDFEKQIITGELKLVKTKTTMDEKVLENMLGKEGIDSVGSMFFNSKDGGLSRANDIMELLEKCEAGLKTRSERKKRQVIKQRLIQLFKANEWQIKDTELANKVGKWIKEYIVDGNLAAYTNFCKLKVMTHKDQPIYSMEEIL